WLFYKDVLTCPQSFDREPRMRVVARSNNYGVDLRVVYDRGYIGCHASKTISLPIVHRCDTAGVGNRNKRGPRLLKRWYQHSASEVSSSDYANIRLSCRNRCRSLARLVCASLTIENDGPLLQLNATGVLQEYSQV